MSVQWRLNKWDGLWRLTCKCGYRTEWVSNGQGKLTKAKAIRRSERVATEMDTHRQDCEAE